MTRAERTPYRRLAAIWVAGLILLVSTQRLAAAAFQESTRPQAAAPATASKKLQAYVKGQIIVKYKDSVTECVHCLLNSKKAFKQATTDASDSLDRLHAKFNVKAARAIFRTDMEEQSIIGAKTHTALKRQHAAKIEAMARTFARRDTRALRHAEPPDVSQVYLLDLPEDTDVAVAVAEFARDPHVAYAAPNRLLTGQSIPNDPFYTSTGSWGQPFDDLWGLKQIQADRVWDLAQGQGVTVAIVDTGIDYAHPDLAANIWTNPGEIPGDGIDNDGNGYVDDVHGWDFSVCATYNLATFNCLVPKAADNDPTDGNGHGTHVAGIVGAVGNNGLGVLGVAPQVRLMAVKGLNDQLGAGWGTDAAMAPAILYAALSGADVINASFCTDPCGLPHPATEEAVNTAHALGVVVVAAAGNEGSDVLDAVPYPAVVPQAIAVSAVDPAGSWLGAPFTNFGRKIDVAAPGVQILSTIASGGALTAITGTVASPVGGDSGPYMYLSGTSMAAPHVSGLAALILSRHPEFTPDEVRAVLRASADALEPPAGYPDPASFRAVRDWYAGYGRVNAVKALEIDSPIVAAISAIVPIANQPSVYEIHGTVTGHGLVRYQLAAGPGSFPQETTVFHESTVPMDNGLLGVWDATGRWGVQTMVLTATDAAGRAFRDRMRVPPPEFNILPPISDRPAMAFNGRDFVIVWQDNGLFAVRVGTDGTVRDAAPVRLTDQGSAPAIACSPRQCLVAFGQGNNLQGVLLSPELAIERTTQITSAAAVAGAPAVAWNGAQYWVIWPDARSSAGSARSPYGARISEDGSVLDPNGRELDSGVGMQVAIGCTPPDCFVAWSGISFPYPSFSQYIIAGRLINSGGGMSTRQEFLRVSPHNEYFLGLHVSSRGSGYLVAWEHDALSSGQALLETRLVDSLGVSMSRSVGVGYLPSNPGGDRYKPVATFDGHDTWLAWHGYHGDIFGVRMDRTTGQPVDTAPLELAISGTSGPWPAIASGGGISLLIWKRDDPTGAVHGMLLPRRNQPPLLRILSPDVDNNGLVTSADRDLVASKFNTADPIMDVDGNGTVNSTDLLLVTQAFGLRWPPSNLAEGNRLVLYVKGTDPEGDPLTYTASQLPAGAVFTQVGTGAKTRGQFIWTPTYAQATGPYWPRFTVSDGASTATQEVQITVKNVPLVILQPYAITPPSFSPNGDGIADTTLFSAAWNHTATWTVIIFDRPLSRLVRRLTGTGTSMSQLWDGRDDTGQALPNGIYDAIFSVSNGGDAIAHSRDVTITGVPLRILTLSASPNPFSPNGDGIQDTTIFTTSFDHAAVQYVLEIRNSSGTLARRFTGSVPGTGLNLSVFWNGQIDYGSGKMNRAWPGTYTATLSATDAGGASAVRSVIVTVQ